jgi:hypothetical protein
VDGLTLLADARRAGLRVACDGERLVVRGPRRLEPVARTLIAEKPAILRALAAEEHEVAWRISVMQPQVPSHGAIPLLLARPGVRFALGTCGSCGDQLELDLRYRCRPCVAAATAVLGSLRHLAVTG